MSAKTQTLTVERFIKATPAQVYYAFTNATALREWLCDVATVTPHPGGRMYLWWNGDFYSSGEYTALEPNQSVSFKWFGRGESAPTQVKVSLAEIDGGTLVTLAHTIPTGKKWEGVALGFKQEWANSLENLASVLVTGQDLRLIRRPMLGVFISDFNAEIAAKLGVPVTEGTRLDGTLEGMSAHSAGLQKNDVLVSIAGKPITNDYSSLVNALQGQRAGGVVEVVFYRGSEKKAVTMELSPRPLPEIPFDPKVLAAAVHAKYDDAYTALAQCFEGVSEAEASSEPAPGEWSAKEVLAHLIHGERGQQLYLDEVIGGQERWSDDYSGNLLAHIRATLTAYPMIHELLEHFRRLQVETVALIIAFPPEFVARKGDYWRIAYQLLEGQTHTHSHLEQIRAAIAAAKK